MFYYWDPDTEEYVEVKPLKELFDDIYTAPPPEINALNRYMALDRQLVSVRSDVWEKVKFKDEISFGCCLVYYDENKEVAGAFMLDSVWDNPFWLREDLAYGSNGRD